MSVNDPEFESNKHYAGWREQFVAEWGGPEDAIERELEEPGQCTLNYSQTNFVFP